MIDGEEKKVYATEAEALSGGQPWDLNPTIYYRVKKPIKELEKLPSIDLTKLFNQSEEKSSLSFVVMNAEMTPE